MKSAKIFILAILQQTLFSAEVYCKAYSCPKVTDAIKAQYANAKSSIIEHKYFLKQLQSPQKITKEIKANYEAWKAEVLQMGLEEVRRRPGLHDEPLQGNLRGCRSVRLSGQARLIYKPRGRNQIEALWIDANHRYDGICPD